MKRTLPFLLIGALSAGGTAGLFSRAAAGAENLVKNAAFEADADADGVPDGWRWAGSGDHVTQTLTLDRGRDSQRCARLSCSRFRSGSPAAHAMICQMGVPVRGGRVYHLRFWARGEAIAAEIVSVALSDTSSWQNCGLQAAFSPGPTWRRHEFLFRASRTCSAKSRLQFWYASTGTLWLDDVEFVEAGPDLYRPGHAIAAGERTNRVPNASFECGPAGWGSAEWDRATHWGGRMNRLFGTVEAGGAFHGKHCLRISLTPQNQPVSFFDYYDLHRMPIRAPLAASIGFLEVRPGRSYTLSAYLKADADDTPARLAVRQFSSGRHFDKAVTASRRWARSALTFKPTRRWCYVLAGPDLRASERAPKPPKQATLWIDAVQLEAADHPTAFAPRDPVEFGLTTDKPGNVFGWKERVTVRLVVANHTRADRKAQIELKLTDFFDRQVLRRQIDCSAPAGGAHTREVLTGADGKLRGFLRLRARLRSGEAALAQTMRLAVIPAYEHEDSRFGVNHAYPWPHLLDLTRKAGLVWVRDWSLKWKDVEPEKGRFTFDQTDPQIDRPLAHRLRMLCMLPFPSSPWSSSASAKEKAEARGYRPRREICARAPRDLKEFETYVEKTVRHYRGRVTWFQVFNEPLFTSYALPRKYGYDGATYATYTRAFVRAARRAHPRCKILAGIGYINTGQIMTDFEKFFAAGGLKAIDAVDIHHYPRSRPPEFIEPMLEALNALMDRHGGRKPIWLTEYGYYADDEPWALPMPNQGFNQPLRSERLQAEYALRWAAICLANGVEKVFYHAGTCAGVNSDSLQGVFYEYAGQPHKVYAAQAVLSRLLPPRARFLRKLALGPGVKGYLFGDGTRLVAVVWAPREAKVGAVHLAADKLAAWDMMGRPMAGRQFAPTGTPVYVVADGLAADPFAKALRPAPAPAP